MPVHMDDFLTVRYNDTTDIITAASLLSMFSAMASYNPNPTLATEAKADIGAYI